MSTSTPDRSPRAPRADVVRNRRRLLDAAVEVVLETGGAPSRDAIASVAGVGIGTLYRHFPDRQSLLRAVALDVLDRTVAEAEAALAEEASGGAALRRYLHAAIDIGLGAVNILHPMIEDTDWPDRRDAARDVLDRLVAAARRDRALGDVDASEVTFAAIRFARPLGIGLDRDADRSIAHRQLDRYLDGLAASVS